MVKKFIFVLKQKIFNKITVIIYFKEISITKFNEC